MTHFAITALAALVLVGTSCSSEDTPPDPSLLAAVEAALCADAGPTILLNGKVYDMSDCPD